MKWFNTFLLALVASLLAGPAMAATVSFQPVVDLAVNFAVAVLSALVPVASGLIALKVNQYLKLKVDEKQRAVIEQGLSRAIGYGVGEAKKRLPSAPAIEVKSEAIAFGVTYAQARIPDALKHFGITPEGVAEMLAARLKIEQKAT